MIKFKNVSVILGKGTALENTALQNINLNINAGEFIILIGNNGAGKSTLLRLLSGEMMPTTGEIYFDKTNVTQLSVEKRAAWIGHVYQDPLSGTCESLTVEENLAFALSRGKKQGLNRALTKQIRTYFKTILLDFPIDLDNKLAEPVATLSGGQRQVLSLIMATLNPPNILLLDEHTAALDPKIANIVLRMSDRLISQHRLTTIMVTHNMTHALTLGSRTLLLQKGQIKQDLSFEERRKLNLAKLLTYF